nr:HEAT repeat domain-containing protein [Anaerolineae bacterium]
MPVDPISLIVGAVVAIALAVLIYTFRDRVGLLRRSAEGRVSATRARLARGVEGNYRSAVVELARRMHIAGHLVPLEKVCIEPAFFQEPPPFDPLDEDSMAYERPHQLVPLVIDWPQMVGPYRYPELKLIQLLNGNHHLLILGLPGSGRTVALARLLSLFGETETKNGPVCDGRLPIYIHLGDVNLSPDLYDVEANPLNPLIEAAAHRLAGVGARLVSAVQPEFAVGNGLFLVDGWDELPEKRRLQAIEWLKVLLESFPGNRLIMSGPVLGYGPLLRLGLTPISIMPWDNARFTALSGAWKNAWPEIAGTSRIPAPEPPEELVLRAARGNTCRTPLDATLHIWATYAGDDPGEGRAGWYGAYIKRVLRFPQAEEGLGRLAEIILKDQDRLGVDLDELTAVLRTARIAAQEKTGGAISFVDQMLGEVRVLTEFLTGEITFTHPTVGAYLAATALVGRGLQETFLDDSFLARSIMPFLAELDDISPYVAHFAASQPDNLLKRSILEPLAWAADAPENAPWRDPVFLKAEQILLGPVGFQASRERAMAALAASQSPEANRIFMKGLQHPDNKVRMLCIIGLGALGNPANAGPLGDLLEDKAPGVDVVVSLALGACANEAALNLLIRALLSGSDLARRAAAELLGATNMLGEGHEILREAAGEEDSRTRKAAVYGLDRANTPWAVELLRDMEKRDSEWLVRTAATTLLEPRREGTYNTRSPEKREEPQELKWLAAWYAERNQNVEPGITGISQLIRTMQEGDEASRLAAIEAIGALCLTDAVKPLYGALRDEHPEIRDSAFRSLCALSVSETIPLPAVM